jgi:hypothetical protein
MFLSHRRKHLLWLLLFLMKAAATRGKNDSPAGRVQERPYGKLMVPAF